MGESPLTSEETLDCGVIEATPSSWIFCRWSPAGATEKLLERRLLEEGDCGSLERGEAGLRWRCAGDDARLESATLTGEEVFT